MSSVEPVGGWFGGIEAGGTKFVCAIGDRAGNLAETVRFPTTSPAETLGNAVRFFGDRAASYSLGAIGIGSFGPVDLHPSSPSFGRVTSTPKPGWSHADVVGAIRRETGCAVAFDTDVNAAALGEFHWGAARGLDTFLYLTVGTGIGGGGMCNGNLLHGLVHPEMGHIRIPHDTAVDPFPGACPFHGDCLEGLASGPAMERRWGQPAFELPPEHDAWKLEARYLALALVNWICTMSPQRIIVGGGVMHRLELFPLIQTQVLGLLNNYVLADEITGRIESYIVPPGLGDNAGIMGALALGFSAVPRG